MIKFIERVKAKIKLFLKGNLYNTNWRCINCGKEIFDERGFCDECIDKLPFITTFCNHCGRSVKVEEDYCLTCKNRLTSIDKGRSVFTYKEPINGLIKSSKYYEKEYILEVFSKYLVDLYKSNNFDADIVTFVPMDKEREKERHYNQSKIMAKYVADKLQLPLHQGVIKKNKTVNQACLNKEQRLKNLIDAFKIVDKKNIKDKDVLIVDDVTTTGATGESLASKLKNAGAKKVYLITVASVPPVDGY